MNLGNNILIHESIYISTKIEMPVGILNLIHLPVHSQVWNEVANEIWEQNWQSILGLYAPPLLRYRRK